MDEVRVLIEAGARRTFATALDWPGWCRAAKDEAGALAALLAYAPRYAAVARVALLELPDPPVLTVSERVPGSATTDFGAPDVPATGDADPVGPVEPTRLLALVEACWRYFDRVAAASPATLRKGPRGGGRDRDAIVEHVVGVEATLAAPKLGLRGLHVEGGDTDGIAAVRTAIAEALRGGPPPPSGNRSRWQPRYAARRIAWHVLDHAWEMEDRGAASAAASATAAP